MMKERFWHELKIVTTKAEHNCAVCGNVIAKGSRTFVEAGKNEHDGFYSCYFHTTDIDKCYLDYFDAIQPSDFEQILGKIKDSTFHGQISYNSWKKYV